MAKVDEFVQGRVLSFVEALAQDPFREGDLVVDAGGRPCQVKILAAIAIHYWADHAEREVRVVDLTPAEDV